MKQHELGAHSGKMVERGKESLGDIGECIHPKLEHKQTRI